MLKLSSNYKGNLLGLLKYVSNFTSIKRHKATVNWKMQYKSVQKTLLMYYVIVKDKMLNFKTVLASFTYNPQNGNDHD